MKENKDNKIVIIASGLPRSGTSMMMKMLEAGGLDILADNVRKADTDNPKGYFEYEKVKDLKKDTFWLPNAKGKGVKVISILLYYLPPTYRYRVVFMKRDMNEIIASQAKMLQRSGHEHDKNDNQMLFNKFEEHLQKVSNWIERQRNIECLYMDYADIIKDPMKNASILNKFLGGKLDTNSMAKSVDSALYRNKAR